MKTFKAFMAKTLLLSFFFLTVAPAIMPAMSSQAYAGPKNNTYTDAGESAAYEAGYAEDDAAETVGNTAFTGSEASAWVHGHTDRHSSVTNISGTANENALADSMCAAMTLVTGNAGKAFAAFAIISLGIGFFTGKISWGLMIGVAMGIAAMFGAPTIVSVLSGDTAVDCG